MLKNKEEELSEEPSAQETPNSQKHSIEKPKEWFNKGIAIANLILSVALIVATKYSLDVSKDMAILMKQTNQNTLRPYVQIEGVAPDYISSLATHDPRNAPVPKGLMPSYLIAQDNADEEYLFYTLKNLGQIPAHDIQHMIQVFAINEKDQIQPVSLPTSAPNGPETLFPSQTSTRNEKLGKGVVISSDPTLKAIRVILKITYTGSRDTDPNVYYYSVTLRSKKAASLAELNKQGPANILIESSDEGIERISTATSEK